MQRRLALAAAFVHDPTLVFLDEPTAGIDPILRSTFWEQFREMRDEGSTMCVTTQYVGEAAYCDYVGLLSDGELLMIDTPENLPQGGVRRRGRRHRAEPGGRRVRAGAELSRIDGVLSGPELVSARMWRLVVEDADEAIDRLDAELRAAALPIIETREHIVDFDEAFVRVIERHRSGDRRRAMPATMAMPAPLRRRAGRRRRR